MKFLKKSIYALSAIGTMGLWSCASEEMLPVDQPAESGEMITLTVTVDRGSATTRTLLEDDGEGGLTSVWKEYETRPSGVRDRDCLYLTDSSGQRKATLSLEEGAGTSLGVFKGSMSKSEFSESEIYNLWYYRDVSWDDYDFFSWNSGNPYTYSARIGQQSFFDLESLSNIEMMSSITKDNNDGIKIEIQQKSGDFRENAYVIQDVKLESRLAMARFSLESLPEDAKGTLYIYNADNPAQTPVEIVFSAGKNYSEKINYSTTVKKQKYDKITVENAGPGAGHSDVYVALIPATYRLGFQFVAEDGTEYVYERDNATDLKYGVYYTDGNGGGISVPFSEVKKKQEWSVIWKDSLSDEIYKNDPVKGIAPHEYDTAEGKPDEPKKEGYKFVGWTYNGKSLPDYITLTEENLSIEILAQWEEDQHTVTTPGYGHGSFD